MESFLHELIPIINNIREIWILFMISTVIEFDFNLFEKFEIM